MNPIRVDFWSLFGLASGGGLVTRRPIFVNGILLPTGSIIPIGSLVGGVDFNQRRGMAIQIVDNNGTAIIQGFYASP